MSILGCFLKQGICKYGYISTKAAFLLFKSEKGPFRNKKRVKLLRKELHEVLKSTVPAYTKKSLTGSNQENKDQVVIVKFISTYILISVFLKTVIKAALELIAAFLYCCLSLFC